jgi:hypothetical protein
MEMSMCKKEWTDIPPDVHDLLRSTKWHLDLFARRLCDEAYACEGNRAGMALNFSFLADDIDSLLCDYGLPSKFEPRWLIEPETETEEIERKLLK